MYKFKIEESLQKILKKLFKKNPFMHKRILNKIREIINSSDVEVYKNLQYKMKDYKRVHIGHFVLVFRFDKKNNLVVFDDFDHHDKIYKK
ncbi:type II toxin-antitoxin system RelE/ParE family toxin [Candidatus Pacearchaeota archaeon]|nr:type II toxin-antitoxin system RelE/ParE family toxin [Candidatus Pacearchaeota archaeon]